MRTSIFGIVFIAAVWLTATASHAQGIVQNVPLTTVQVSEIQSAVRASDVIGAKVANDRNENIGTVDDVLIQVDDQKLYTVISVGGFLGMGEKHVVIPFTSLKMGAVSGGQFDRNKVILPGANKKALEDLPRFEYARR